MSRPGTDGSLATTAVQGARLTDIPTEAATIVVVEDDVVIGQAIVDALGAHGYRPSWCRTGEMAMNSLEHAPDLVLLDAGLPDVDGFTLCRWLRRKHRSMPIVIVTARDSEIDIVVGLDAGANDYITKPFSMNVLLARVRAHLRETDSSDPAGVITVGSMRVEPESYLVTVDHQPVELRPREFELLVVLARSAGRVVTRERLLAEVWDLHWDTSTKTLDMHVLALRRKLGDAIELATVRGVGYRLVTP